LTEELSVCRANVKGRGEKGRIEAGKRMMSEVED